MATCWSAAYDANVLKAISFAWTTPALLARRKTCTRRAWDDRYALQFHEGDLCAAYNKQVRYGGKRVAVIRLTETPYKQSTAKAPDSDWEAEGFDYLQAEHISVDGMQPSTLWEAWRRFNPQMLYVIRFEIVSMSVST